MTRFIDLRSDTVTQPTTEMRKAMAEAVVGDDILGEDPTVSRLESLGAQITGKEAGLFVISGTMANQVAVMAMTERGDEILVSDESHIFNLEVGGLAALSGVQARTLTSHRGYFDLAELKMAIRAKGLQSPITRVLCMENTFGLNRGIAFPPKYFAEISGIAREYGLKVYLDGARLFNASIAVGADPSELCREVDAVSICLSKGLAAPVGSLIMGTRSFIEKARWVRQRLGGGMRQAGHMAAACIVALNTMISRLQEDHVNAARLAKGLWEIHPSIVDLDLTQTNIVHADFAYFDKTSDEIVAEMRRFAIKVKPIGPTTCRMVTHWEIRDEDINIVLEAFKKVLN